MSYQCKSTQTVVKRGTGGLIDSCHPPVCYFNHLIKIIDYYQWLLISIFKIFMVCDIHIFIMNNKS